MKTLLERAKPELLTGMELEAERLPNLVEGTRKWLSENYFCNAMTWSTWVDVRGFWSKATNELASNPWEIFEDYR